MDLLRPTVFSANWNIYKVAIIKKLLFLFSSFLPPRSFFFCFPFPSLVWFWSYRSQKASAFWRLFTEMSAYFHRLVFKKWARQILGSGRVCCPPIPDSFLLPSFLDATKFLSLSVLTFTETICPIISSKSPPRVQKVDLRLQSCKPFYVSQLAWIKYSLIEL